MSTEDTFKLAKNGLPFKSEEAAKQELAKLEMPTDVWGVMPKDGGWVIIKHAAVLDHQRTQQEKQVEQARTKSLAGEQYWWVEFAGRGSPQDSEMVEIGWQGVRITVKRETRIALPDRFLGVCDCAVQQTFEPAPRGSASYVRAGEVRRRVYRKLGEARREDFLKMWNEGNEITRSHVLASGGKPHEVTTSI